MACHKSDQAMSPFLNFQRMGLLSSNLIAAHMTTLTPDEIALCGVEKVNVAHCPTSNLKLAVRFLHFFFTFSSRFRHVFDVISERLLPGARAARGRGERKHTSTLKDSFAGTN